MQAMQTLNQQQQELVASFFNMAAMYQVYNPPAMALSAYIDGLKAYPHPIGVQAFALAPSLSPLGKMPSASLIHALAWSIKKWSFRAARRYAKTWALPHMVNADQRAGMHAPTLPQIYAGIERAQGEVRTREAQEAAERNPPVALIESHEDATAMQQAERFRELCAQLEKQGVAKYDAMLKAGRMMQNEIDQTIDAQEREQIAARDAAQKLRADDDE
jgi:hypothetical protein